MQPNDIQTAAINLKKAYKNIQSPPEFMKAIYNELLPYISKAEKNILNIQDAPDSIPGNFQFLEGKFCDFPDFQEAYVDFKLELEGGEDADSKSLLDKIDKL